MFRNYGDPSSGVSGFLTYESLGELLRRTALEYVSENNSTLSCSNLRELRSIVEKGEENELVQEPSRRTRVLLRYDSDFR
jgi:hypothetical protein